MNQIHSSFRIAALCLTLCAAPAFAASQGDLGRGKGATSAGSMRVGLMVPEMVRLSGVEDLMMGWDEGERAFQASDDLCVYRNLSGQYAVKATGTHGATEAYRMSGPDGSALDYQVSWQGEPLRPGETSAAMAGAHATAMDCGGQPNATLTVSASGDRAAQASSTGLHTDTLVLEIIAE